MMIAAQARELEWTVDWSGLGTGDGLKWIRVDRRGVPYAANPTLFNAACLTTKYFLYYKILKINN